MPLLLKNEQTELDLERNKSLLWQGREQVGMTDLVIIFLVSLFFLLYTSLSPLLSPSFPEACWVRGATEDPQRKGSGCGARSGDEAWAKPSAYFFQRGSQFYLLHKLRFHIKCHVKKESQSQSKSEISKNTCLALALSRTKGWELEEMSFILGSATQFPESQFPPVSEMKLPVPPPSQGHWEAYL